MVKIDVVQWEPIVSTLVAVVLYTLGVWVAFRLAGGLHKVESPPSTSEPVGLTDQQDGSQYVSPSDRIEAAVLLSFLSDRQQWLQRKVDHVQFLDADTVEWSVTLELTPPRHLPSNAPIPDLEWLPVLVMRKGDVVDLDVRDEQGVGIPTSSPAESDRLAGIALTLLAELALNEPPPGDVAHFLRHLPSLSYREAISHFDAMSRRASGDTRTATWSQLVSNPVFMAVAGDLASGRVVLASTPLDPGRRRVLRYSYQSGLYGRPTGFRRLAQALGWLDFRIILAVPGASQARTYRLTVEVAGDDLEFRGAELREFTRAAPPADGRHLKVQGTRKTQAGVVMSLTGASAASHYEADVSIGARPGGFLLLCLLTTWFVAILLGFGLIHLDEVSKQVEALTTLLALVPTVALGLLVRQGEHGMATRIFAGLRRLLILSVSASLAANLALIADYSVSTVRSIWTVAFGVAAFAALAILASTVLARRRHLRSTQPETEA